MKKVLEKTIVNDIIKYLRGQNECFCWKEHGGMYGTSGIPDVICCYKGKFIGFEVKRPGGKPTKLQLHTIDQIKEAGGQAEVVYSVDDVKRMIDKI